MTIIQNLQRVQNSIKNIALKCERNPNSIKLLAVSKTKPINQIEQAIQAGQRLFGENYVQEGVEKIIFYKQNQPNLPLEWHFIGPLQSNKTKLVAEHFDWVQTLDRVKIAQRLNDQRASNLPPLNVLIQVNISHEESKSGIHPDDILLFAKQIAILPNLKLRGLMAIPKVEIDPNRQILTLTKMHNHYQILQKSFPNIDTLSMGMSDDLASAINAGSSMVRIGTAIFGARQYN